MHRSDFVGLVLMLVAVMTAAPNASLSAEKMMVCAFSEVRKCTPLGTCQRVSPKEVNLAPIVMLDLENKELFSVSIGDSGRREAIDVKMTNDAVFLNGQQGKEAWSAVISLTTGSMTANVSLEGVGFVMFGDCAPN